jgi:TIR domain
MSDIFISDKREEQAIARKLADALENKGWSVWWDPKLRAGEHFDDMIEKALNEAMGSLGKPNLAVIDSGSRSIELATYAAQGYQWHAL